MKFGQPLLALVALELGPELEVVVQHCQRVLVVTRQSDLLPELLGQVGPLDCFHVQVALSLLFEDGGVPGVGERARMARTQACQIVLVAAESLRFGPT